MPATIKIFIFIKLIVFILLLHQTNGFRNQSFKHFIRPLNAKVVPGFAPDSIIMKWMNTETALRKSFFNLIKSSMTANGMSLISNVSQNCTYSLFEYFNGLRNMKSWAYKMLDSTGKIPNGVIGGNPMSFGDFDTCLEIESPSRNFQGQYCYVEFSLPLPERAMMTPVERPVEAINGIFEPESMFDHVAKRSRFLYNSQLRLTTCLPSTCSKQDIATLFTNIAGNTKSAYKVSVPQCEIKEYQKFTATEIFIFTLFSFLICLVVLGTAMDILIRIKPKHNFETKEKSTTKKILLCFSACTNCIRLLKVDNNPDTLRIFHGIRVVSISWIIWTHTYFVISYRAFDGAFYFIDMAKQFAFQTVPLGFLPVENFFFMSSVLLSYVCVRMRGKINMPLIFCKRYLRLTPTMMLVVALFAVIGRFGSGPLWKETIVDSLSKNCLERGWINIFYINNYLYSSKSCIGWTWYIATDTQMFLVALCICVILRRRSGLGLLLAGLVFITGVLLSAFSHMYYKLPPTYLNVYMNFDDWFSYAVKGYTPVHFHFPVYAVGLIVGSILAKKKGHIPKHINAIGWFLSVMTFFTLMCLNYKWNQGSQAHPSLFVSTLYGTTYRLAWSLCLAFITLSCTWGQGGIFNSFLSWEGFVPFSRLTYIVYLVHVGLIYIYTGSTRQSITLSHRSLVFLFFNNMIASFVTAFVLCLFFESPLMALEKAFADGKLRKQVQPVNAVEGTVFFKK